MRNYLFLSVVLFSFVNSNSQTNLTLNSYVTPANISNQQRITLLPGANVIGGFGNSRLYIDPSISLSPTFPAAGNYGTTPVVYNLDVNKPVGSIPYSFKVNSVGSAECNVPIPCPVGTNGMKPSLSFMYNSFSANGELGSGWSINGLQKISRVGNTLYHNNSVGSINLTNTDNFTLNGNRLLVTSGSNGASSSVYTTEQNVFSRVTSYGVTGNGPTWFRVETKDGLILEFGNTAESRFVPVNASTVMEWYLNRVWDYNGNYMDYNYYNSNGEILIKEIQYTGNSAAGISPYNTVKFYYNLKSDKNTTYVYGSDVAEKSILRSLEIKHENTFVSEYNFNYVSYFGTSYLTEIKLKGQDFTEINSLKFSYQNDAGAPALQSTSGLSNPNYYSKYLFLDFTGDGKKDAVAFDAVSFNANYSTYFQWLNWRALKNNGASSFVQLGSTTSFPAGYIPYTGIAGTSGKGVLGNCSYSAFDFNGDNKEDFLMATIGSTSDVFKIHISNGTGFNAAVNLTVTKFNTSQITPNKYWFVDMDGDKKLDLLYMDNCTGINGYTQGDCYMKIYLDVATGNSTPASSYLLANLDANTTTIVDSDGDGRSELIIGSYSSPTAYSNININTISSPLAVASTNAFRSIDHPNYQTFSGSFQPYGNISIGLDGDYNGDGKSDFIVSTALPGGPPVNYKFEMFLGKGDGTYTAPILLNKTGLGLQNFTQPGYFYYSSDMNGDGKTDIIEISGGNTIKVYFSKGNDGTGDCFFSEIYACAGINQRDFDITDVDGNGVNDIINYDLGTMNPPTSVLYFYKGAISKNIREMVDGFGRKTEVTSAPLPDATVYSRVGSKVYPLSIFCSPMYVVKTVSTPDGIGGVLTDSYQYEDAVFHKRGKSFLCFSKITKLTTAKNAKKVDEYSYDATKFNSYRTKTSNYALAQNQLLSDEVLTNVNFTYGALGYYPFLNINLETNYLQNFTTLNQWVHDLNGNITATERNIKNGLDREQTFYYGFVANGSWMPYKPTSVNKSITRTGQPLPYSRTNSYVYDLFGHLQTINEDAGDPKMVSKNYVYDTNTGVMLSESVSSPGSGLPVKNTTFVYDPKFRMPVEEINPLNQSSKRKYSFVWGKPLEVKEADGSKTIFQYNGYGRPLMSTSSDNITVSYSYDWTSPADFTGNDPLSTARCLYKITTNKSGSPLTKSYFDKLDRELRKEIVGFNGISHYSMIEYNSWGNKSAEAAEYQLIQNNSFDPIISSYTYDNLGRLTTASSQDPNNTKTSSYTYAYNTGNITVTTTHPDGKITSRTQDASDLLVTAVDNGGTINYVYHACRKIKAATVNGVQANLLGYDNLGMLSSMQDRDAGIILYNHNAYGELLSQTDANNKTYNFTYDELGRILTKTGPDGTYSYQYVSNGPGQNKILKETAGNGYFSKYYYDNLGRMNIKEESIDGQTYPTEYTFDMYNRVEKIKYPGGFTIKNFYNSYGYLFKISNDANNQSIWTCNSTNSLGKISDYLSGNGIQTQLTYDNFGFLNMSVSSPVQSNSYNYDFSNGNLLSRTDWLLNKTEIFGYDNLDRLTQVQISGLPNFNLTYNNSGNVLTKTGLGNISYKTSKPDAVHNVTNPSGIINTAPTANNQNLTHTPFNKVQSITENTDQYDVIYGCDQQRRKTALYNNGNLVYSKIYAGAYEKTTAGLAVTEVHYINSPSGLCAIYVVSGGSGAMYYPYQDHIGNITKVTDANGAVIASLNYDAWGRMRNSTTWDYSNPSSPPAWLSRGFTKHEHLPEFNLINMNGRLYDPVLGQMLSPDKNNQMPNFTQNFNRYAYAYNNPLKYTDPTGDFAVVDAWIIGFIRGAITGLANGTNWVKGGWDRANRQAMNDIKIYGGLFASDKANQGTGKRVWEVQSRLTAQILQTAIGLAYNLTVNFFGNVDEVIYFHGATVVYGAALPGSGMTLGSYISLPARGHENEPGTGLGSYTLMHEYGHYLQSQKSGPAYLFKYAIPSAEPNAGATWTEEDANLRAAKYFHSIDRSFTWDQDWPMKTLDVGPNGSYDTQRNKYSKLAKQETNFWWWQYP